MRLRRQHEAESARRRERIALDVVDVERNPATGPRAADPLIGAVSPAVEIAEGGGETRFLRLEDGDSERFRDMNRRALAAMEAGVAGDPPGIAEALGMEEPPRGSAHPRLIAPDP